MTSGVGVAKVSTFPPQRTPTTTRANASRGILRLPRALTDDQAMALWLTTGAILGVALDIVAVYSVYRWMRR
jgi:hypothetical protein